MIHALFVIANLNGHSVTLEYDPPHAPVPLVIGKNDNAATHISYAKMCGVPIFSNPTLAETLYSKVRVGTQIPYRLYAEIAEYIAALMSEKVSAA